MIITLDGFSAVGKTSLGSRLAKELDYIFIDTGLIYRYFAYKLYDEENIVDNINLFNDNFIEELNDEEFQQELQTLEVGRFAGELSKNNNIRNAINSFVRKYCKNKNCIVAGRDVALNIFPDADLRILLSADLEKRVERRLKDKFYQDRNEIEQDLINRDLQVQKYILAIAKIATLLDTMNMNFDESFDYIHKLVKDVKKKQDFISFVKLLGFIIILIFLYLINNR